MNTQNAEVIIFGNLIEAGQDKSNLGQTLTMDKAAPFEAGNAPSVIAPTNRQQVAEVAREFGARFKAAMPS